MIAKNEKYPEHSAIGGFAIQPLDNPAICLTDTPEVVKLKQDFRACDELEETLKLRIIIAQDDLRRIRQCKEAIARKIFGQNPNPK